jgi:hypothetical protein
MNTLCEMCNNKKLKEKYHELEKNISLILASNMDIENKKLVLCVLEDYKTSLLTKIDCIARTLH